MTQILLTAEKVLLDLVWRNPRLEAVSNETEYVQALRAVAVVLDEKPGDRLV